MPKPHSLPHHYEDLLQLNISKLKEWNYLNGHKISSGTITWSVRGEKTGAVNIFVDTNCTVPFMRLEFTFNGEPTHNVITLIQHESNLIGKIWYFICPITGKQCRKLLQLNGVFAHREAHKHCMYELQTYSKRNRELIKLMTPKFKESQLIDEVNSKYFKKYYAGKQTKRYKRILSQLTYASKISIEQYQNAFFM